MRPHSVLSLITAAVFSTAPALAQEHPEHPAKPTEKGTEMTMDLLAKGIETYIQKDSKLKGGHFVVFDPVDKKPLALTLEKVHRDKLASIGNNVYFACTDMKATDGTLYDLDFFMAEDESGGLQATEVSIHKKAGKPRYGWKEEGGTWKRAP